MIYDLASLTYTEVVSTGWYPAWLPDDRRLLYANDDELVLLDTATKASTVVFSSPGETLGGPGLSPDAREIYLTISRRQSDIVLAKLTGGAP